MTLNQALISETTLSTDSASVTIPVPSGYTDLRLVMSARVGSGSSWIGGVDLSFNGVRTTNLRRLYAAAGTVYSDTNVGGGQGEGGLVNGVNSTAGTFSNIEIYIPNYSATGAKSYSIDGVVENNSANDALVSMFAGLNSTVTSAITSITLSTGGYSFMAGSSFTLYGISKLGVTPTQTPKATGGDIIKNDGTYWYHIFQSTGIFQPQTSVTCDYAVVGGAGGGAVDWGGGGGAGGWRTSIGGTPLSLTATNYTVTVGAGGIGGTRSNGANGGSGTASTLSTISAAGGGGGGSYNGTKNGLSGASGGGGSGTYGGDSAGTGGTGNTPSTSPAQGYNGGSGYGPGDYGSNRYGGGGGGATAAGSNATSGTYGPGGTGVTSSISGTSTTYATGGDGCHSYSYSGVAGAVNSGAGGQGGGENVGGTNGGSGIVIIRYAMA
jgi:hypothetical protein